MSDAKRDAIIYAGLDEAGRGCVIGPMTVAIVAADEKARRKFAEWNVRDSKLIPPEEREELADKIRARCWHRILSVEPREIDEALADPWSSLNELEIELMITLVRAFQQEHGDIRARILSDALGRKTDRHADRLWTGSLRIPGHAIMAAIRADGNDRTVAAASILAKSERERRIAELKRDLGTDFGCGYSHDEHTIAFLKTCPANHPCVRWSWKTAMREEG